MKQLEGKQCKAENTKLLKEEREWIYARQSQGKRNEKEKLLQDMAPECHCHFQIL